MERRKANPYQYSQRENPEEKKQKSHWISDETLLAVEARREMKARRINNDGR